MELKAGIKGGDIAVRIKELIGDKVLVSPFQSRVSIEIRDIEPLESKEDLQR